ncbi:MAG: hypothetical protein OXI74_09465 [Rhodospirillaceae bacterium]|nr:hypothetical protein [Rhodospirillaceae bacterium]
MTDQERDELLLELAAGQKRIERKVDALSELPAKVDRILEVAQGQAAARLLTDDRVAVLERRVAELERRVAELERKAG